MLVLSNEEIANMLTIDDCLDVLEQAYRYLGNGQAGNVPRADLLVEIEPGITYGLKTMSGAVPAFQVGAIRLNSDIVHWPTIAGNTRRVKIPAAPGERWVGLVLLFSTRTGEPLAIFPDGVVQRMRVGATAGLAAKYLARRDAKVVGLFGSGWQAGSHAMAMAAVRELELIKVYSPTEANRRRFAAEMTETLGIEVRAVDTREEAAEADIIVCATNALDVVYRAAWLRPGVHVTCVRPHELEGDVYRRSDLVFINYREGKPKHYVIGDKREEEIPEIREGWNNPTLEGIDLENKPELAALVAGKVAGRRDDRQVTCFCNNIGLGFQFAAVGARVLELARQKGVGRELPVEWFTQNVHP